MRDLRLERPRANLAEKTLEARRLLEKPLQVRTTRVDAEEGEERFEVGDLVLKRSRSDGPAEAAGNKGGGFESGGGSDPIVSGLVSVVEARNRKRECVHLSLVHDNAKEVEFDEHRPTVANLASVAQAALSWFATNGNLLPQDIVRSENDVVALGDVVGRPALFDRFDALKRGGRD